MIILISNMRKSKNISLRKLSELCGIPKSTLHDFEKEICSPRLDQLEAIAKAIDVRITDLFDSAYK